MRIPFPERVPINRVAIFAAVLFAVQMAEGTALYFSIGCVVFILIAAFAFNAAGGLTRASGAYVFFYSVLVLIIGVCYKAFLGEAAQSNLLDPRTDIEVYVASIAGMFGAVIVSRRLSRKTGLLQNMLREEDMYRASIGCVVVGVAGSYVVAWIGLSGLQSAFNQLNQLIPLGIIIGVMYEIRSSGGSRSINLPTAMAGFFMFVNGGIIYFSKQAMLTPFYCWLLPVCALRYRLSARQVLTAFVGAFMIFYYLVPYSQYGRGEVTEYSSLSERISIATSLFEHLDQTRQSFEEQENSIEGPRGLSAYYDKPQGLWERLQMVSADDKLFHVTDQGKVFGLLPIKLAFINVVPHFIWPNKPTINVGNAYAHEINGESQGEGDITTGISFSPSAEAYHVAKWTGVLVLAPLLWCLLFIEFDSLFGDLRSTPWGLLAMAILTHVASEGALSNMIYIMTFGVEIIVFCAFFATWFGPIFAAPFLGPDRRTPNDLSLRPTLVPRVPR